MSQRLINVVPFEGDFAAEVGDVDLREPLASDRLQLVREAFSRYAVLVFPAQDLSVEQHLAFAANFGPLETTVATQMTDRKLRTRPEIADIANLDSDGRIWKDTSRTR